MYHSNLVTISTKFNATLAYNTKIRFRNFNKEERFKYTEIQREKAKNAVLSVDLAILYSPPPLRTESMESGADSMDFRGLSTDFCQK